MSKKHAKSPCCKQKVINFGYRRKQCTRCKKTWRTRKRKVGRKKKRITEKLALNYINRAIPSLKILENPPGKKSSARYLARKSRNKLLSSLDWANVPENEPLIAIADAVMHHVAGKIHAIYIILLRPIRSSKALITEPYLAGGNESWAGWQEAFDRLPKGVSDNICALVADRHPGLRSVAMHRGWLFQGCHFHIISQLLGRRSKRKWSHHQAMGEDLYQLAKNILTDPDEETVRAKYIPDILSIRETITSPKTRGIISGFAKNFKLYRTYLEHPELNLPKTSNSSESLNSSFQDFCYRARGFRTLESFTKWLHTFLKTKKTVTCNGCQLPTK